jgi:hypothetical protein
MQSVCHIVNGKVANPSDLRAIFDALQDGVYQIKVSPRRVRSLPQNKYYWGVVVDLVHQGLVDAGFNEVKTPEDAHEVMKNQFLHQGSTVDLTTTQFNEYLDQVAQWAAEYLGISIPLPD